jgi:FMN phosphatase YigB (HAD superfamily)
MAQKQPVLAVFDVDGTLAKIGDPPDDMYDGDYLMGLESERNMVAIVEHYMNMENVELMFCTGRPKRAYQPTWQWLNKTLGLAASGKRVSLVCRPNEEPESRIAAVKLHEIVQALRRIGSKPSEAFIYDDDLSNLRLFASLRPMVRHLHLFKVEDGIATAWSL